MNYDELRTAMEATGKLIQLGDGGKCCDTGRSRPASRETDQHLRWMVKEAMSWGPERADKLSRWLGFVQGCLWSMGLYTIENLRQVNLEAKTK